jgi:hypothetical protein
VRDQLASTHRSFSVRVNRIVRSKSRVVAVCLRLALIHAKRLLEPPDPVQDDALFGSMAEWPAGVRSDGPSPPTATTWLRFGRYVLGVQFEQVHHLTNSISVSEVRTAMSNPRTLPFPFQFCRIHPALRRRRPSVARRPPHAGCRRAAPQSHAQRRRYRGTAVAARSPRASPTNHSPASIHWRTTTAVLWPGGRPARDRARDSGVRRA